jgi:hypothetical protein
LHYASVRNGKIQYDIVDGNAQKVQPYEEVLRVRTASNVGVSNACAVTSKGIQVFYRDDTQGVLLGAHKNFGSDWKYELIDGDRKKDSRTTGDVAFHLKALVDGDKTYVLYDSVLEIDQNRDAISGEIRLATSNSQDPTAWSYRTVETPSVETPVLGYDVEIAKTTSGIIASWFSSTALSRPNPTMVNIYNISTGSSAQELTTANFGKPTEVLSSDAKTLIFNCFGRLCSVDYAKFSKGQSAINLVSSWPSVEPIASTSITLNKVRYIAAGINGKVVLLKAS